MTSTTSPGETRALLAHLFRRAAFGANASTLDAYASKSYDAAVSDLLNPSPESSRLFNTLRGVRNGLGTVTNSLKDAQDNWARAMVLSPTPLIERMTLFLSNHFAIAYSPDNHCDAVTLVHQQNTIRKYALGSFSALTHSMIDDMAFAAFLNNDRNKKEEPNENLGRELLELFVLGIGTFTEHDVRETARALTGYTIKTTLPGGRGRLVYDAKLHDPSPKTILGTTSNFTPHGLITYLLARPEAHRFIATKLVKAFYGATDTALIDAVAASLAQNWNLSAALRTIFTSSQFRGAEARHTVAKMPAEFVTGLMRSLARDEYTDAHNAMANAGQTLFKPPSVAGWPTGARVLGAGALLARYNFAASLANKHTNDPRRSAPTFGTNIQSWMGALGLTQISSATNDAITSYLAETTAAKLTTKAQTAGLITLLASSPEYHLA